MNRKDVFECRGVMELDTTYELEIFLDEVFKRFAKESITEVSKLLEKYPFMSAEWEAVNNCQRAILSLIPKDIL